LVWETLAIFAVSLVVLGRASYWVIDSAIKLSEFLGISGIAAGYIFIAFGTSLPDFMVAVQASLSNQPGIAFGDVLGSSIANICLVLGIAALIKPLYIRREQTLESAELLLITSLIPLVLIYLGAIDFTAGLFLLFVFLLYVFLVLRQKFTMDLPVEHSKKELGRNIAVFAVGLLAVILSARFVISSTSDLARLAGVPEALIGMTLIAFGTTLPELAVDFVAIRRGHAALAIGDVLGSSVINLTLVLGSAVVLNPIINNAAIYGTAMVFLVGVNFFLWYMLMKHEGISRNTGLILVVSYILFLAIEILVSFGLLGRSPTGAIIAGGI